MTPKTVTLVIVCAVAIAGLLGPGERSSSGQQENIRKQPACTIYCGDGPDTINLGAKPCWGGPLPAAGAGDHFKSLAAEDQAAICRNVATASTRNASCPAFKALAQLCKGKEKPPPNSEDKKPPCKERGPYDVPWFDPSAEGCQNLQDTRMNANWTAANGGTCTITLTACNYTVLTYTVNYVHEENGKLTAVDVSGIINQVTAEQLAAGGDRPIRRSECNSQLYEEAAGDYPNKVCCDIWREGVGAGSGCNPETDADCDGLPNNRDNIIYSRPYYAPARAGGAGFSGGDAADFNPANFDSRPPGLNWDEVMPNEPCKKCKWMAQSGKLTCSPDGRTDHEYKVTWLCPSSGVTRIVTKRAPATAPCTPPRRG
ncbi:MAG TPA: hypothetical protein VGQ72_03420 [Pyrinomonadaceae bacterium]|jgi:hypothetical protein|nr:hypothetical protein [Pyrinomonadaceae bacterium]